MTQTVGLIDSGNVELCRPRERGHDVIYFTLLRIPTAATVSGYVRCAHVALAIPLSMLAYLPQCRKTAGGGG